MYQRKFFLIIFTLLFSNFVCAEEVLQPSEPLRVGIIVPLTGGIATWGLSVRTSIELANRDSENPAELFFEDEETCVPAKALTAFNRLRSVHHVDVLIASCLGGARAIGPLARQSKLPYFISGRSSREFQKSNPNALSWISLLDYEGQAIGELIAKEGWKRGTAMIWQEYFGVQFAEGIRSALKEQKSPFAYEVFDSDPGSSPTGSDVERVLRSKPEVIFMMMSESVTAFVMKQLKAFNYKGKIVLQSSMLQTYDKNVRSDFAGALQQKFVVNEEKFQDLRQRVKDQLHAEVADDFVYPYDGFKALLREAAFCRADPKNSLDDCLTERLRNETWQEGVSGRFRFMKDGSTERPMVIKTITEDGFR